MRSGGGILGSTIFGGDRTVDGNHVTCDVPELTGEARESLASYGYGVDVPHPVVEILPVDSWNKLAHMGIGLAKRNDDDCCIFFFINDNLLYLQR